MWQRKYESGKTNMANFWDDLKRLVYPNKLEKPNQT